MFSSPLRKVSGWLTFGLVVGVGGASGQPPVSDAPVHRLPTIDNRALLTEDETRAAPGVPLRYAKPVKVAIYPEHQGAWSLLPDGDWLWRLRVSSPGAVSLNFGFTRFRMPVGGQLRIYSLDGRSAIRPFTAGDNKDHGQLWTPVLRSDEAVLEVRLPIRGREGLELELTHIGHGYRPFPGGGGESGACNVDVVCAVGNPWRKQIRSVAVYSLSGYLSCTGFMVNNTAQDLTSYFMTADHCYYDPLDITSLVAYWNYENSTCRRPGGPKSGAPGDGTLDQFQSGATYLTSDWPSDFLLVVLDDPPDPEWDVFWAGWDATPGDSSAATAVHHPQIAEKRISLENDPTTTTSYLDDSSPGDGTHVRIADWDLGTTEPGSSGSPLFNPDGRVIGQLHGGYAACDNDDPDWYGRFSVSWDGGGTARSGLKSWLDPLDTGLLALDGRDLGALSAKPPFARVCQPAGAVFQIEVEELDDSAEAVTLSLSGHPLGAKVSFWPNPVVPPGTSTLIIGFTGRAEPGYYPLIITGTSSGGTETIRAVLELVGGLPGVPILLAPPDGSPDQEPRPIFSWAEDSMAESYTIEIASDGGFSNIVDSASGLVAPNYRPGTHLPSDSIFSWRVRSENTCGKSPYSAIWTFRTSLTPGDCLGPTAPVAHFRENFESGAPGWTHSGIQDTWQLSDARTQSGSHSYWAEGVGSVSDQLLVSPPIALPATAADLRLQFWNYQDIEQSLDGCYDGAVLEISTDEASWTRLESELQTDPYDGPVSESFHNPLAGDNGWCGNPQDWLESVVDIQAWTGQTVSFRFRLATDTSGEDEGWYIDDVLVQSCASSLIFEDGFESGDTSTWSNGRPPP
jgi:hypothetical protein